MSINYGDDFPYTSGQSFADELNSRFVAIKTAINGAAGADPNTVKYRGAWNAATAIKRNDIVSSNGGKWLALNDSTNSAPVEGADWTTFGAAPTPGPKGDKGDAGAVGAQGPTGAAGANGQPGAVGPQGLSGTKGDKGDKGDSGNLSGLGAIHSIIGSDLQPGDAAIFYGDVPLSLASTAAGLQNAVQAKGGTFATRTVALEKTQPSSGINRVLNVVGTASSTFSAAYGPEKATDGTTNTGYWSSVSGGFPAWLRWDLGTTRAIEKYTITRANTSTGIPKTWKIEASATGEFAGEQTVVDSKTDFNIVDGVNNFVLSQVQSFRYWRLYIIAATGTTSVVVDEFQLVSPPLGGSLNLTINTPSTVGDVPPIEGAPGAKYVGSSVPFGYGANAIRVNANGFVNVPPSATDVQKALAAIDARIANSGTPGAPSGGAGGVLSGQYPNPGFAVDMATQAELDNAIGTRAPTVHTHTAAQITDFSQAVRGSMEYATGAPVQTIAELRAVPVANRQDKQQRLVEDAGASYRFDLQGTGADNGDGILAPTAGTGRWFKASGAASNTGNADTLGGQNAGYYLARANHTGAQAISSVAGLQGALDGKAATGHTHDAGALVSGVVAPERLGTGTRDGTNFLRDDGTFAAATGATLPAIAAPYGYLEAPQWARDFNNGVSRTIPAASLVLITRSDVVFPVTISKARYCLTTEVAGSNVGIAIYDSAGNRVTHWAGAGSGSAFPQQNLIGGAVTLATGSYWVAFTSDNAGVVWQSGQIPSNAGIVAGGGASGYVYSIGNSSNAGVCPSVMGTRTPRTDESKFPYIKFF